MAKIRAIILRTTSNGPFALEYAVDGTVLDVINNIASAASALDIVKTKVGAQGGTVNRVNMNVDTV